MPKRKPTSTTPPARNFDAGRVNAYHRRWRERHAPSVSTLNQSINAVRFYYGRVLNHPLKLEDVERPQRVQTLPRVLSTDEVARLLRGVRNPKHRLMLHLLYGAGLRAGKLLALRLTELRPDVGMLHVREGKGLRACLDFTLRAVLAKFYSVFHRSSVT